MASRPHIARRAALSLVLALVAPALVACGGDDAGQPPSTRPRVIIDVDRSSCSSGCTGGVELELLVLTTNAPLPCIIDSQTDTQPSGSTVFEALDLKDGDELGVGVKLRCQNDGCTRCWARRTITVSDGARVDLPLKAMALGCAVHGDVVFDNPLLSKCGGL